MAEKKAKLRRVCAYCGKRYETHRPESRFCRPSCRVVAYQKAQREELRRLRNEST